MLPEDAIKLEDGDPLLEHARPLTRRGSGPRRAGLLVELEQLALHAIEVR